MTTRPPQYDEDGERARLTKFHQDGGQVGMTVKVCSGIAKGINLKSPTGGDVRPTSGKVRQAIFSALSGKICGSCVLDLYAGTGAMGIEALSRGAAKAVFVEISSSCLRTIKQNLELTRLSDRAALLGGDALRIIRRLGRQSRKFDIVIADPPYGATRLPQYHTPASVRPAGRAERRPGGHGEPEGEHRRESSLAEKTLKVLLQSDILRGNSIVVLEHSESASPLKTPAGLRLLSARKYGDTSVSIFSPV